MSSALLTRAVRFISIKVSSVVFCNERISPADAGARHTTGAHTRTQLKIHTQEVSFKYKGRAIVPFDVD